jgi:hypothetical protein
MMDEFGLVDALGFVLYRPGSWLPDEYNASNALRFVIWLLFVVTDARYLVAASRSKWRRGFLSTGAYI